MSLKHPSGATSVSLREPPTGRSSDLRRPEGRQRPGGPGGEEVSRRSFLKSSILTVGGVISAVLLYPAARYFLHPALRRRGDTTWTQVAPVSEIPVGTPTFITYEERVKDGWTVVTLSKGAWVLTSDGQDFRVYDPHCTHLGCPYYWNPDRGLFLCPCHDGVFDIQGNVVSGPPPRALDTMEHMVEGGNLFLGRTIASNVNET